MNVAEGFGGSRSEGFAVVRTFAYICADFVAVGLVAVLVVWFPAAIRTFQLRRSMPGASFDISRRIPGFWGRLTYLDPDHDGSTGLVNSVASVDVDSVVVWGGVIHPFEVAALPTAELTRIEIDRRMLTPYERRLIVLRFALGEVTVELPLALRRVAGFGRWRLMPKTQYDLVRRLSAQSPLLASAASALRE